MKKSLFLFSAIAVGILFPQGHYYAYLIRYLIMLILFCSLLDLKIEVKSALNPRLGTIIAMMMAIAGITAWISNWVSPELALAAFMIAMAPTAAAAPVMTRFLDGRVDYVMSSVIVTNSFSAIALPLVLPLLHPNGQTSFDLTGLANTLTVIMLPLGLTQLMQHYAPALVKALDSVRGAGFYFWMAAIYLSTAKATHFIEVESTYPWIVILEIAAVSLLLCTFNFGVGRWLGGYDWGQEMGQSLGQKNTLFSIWVCLTFLTPAIALGPMFYVVFQNLYNSYLLARKPQLKSG
jgi:BASS family bile acid:Na+ symporter